MWILPLLFLSLLTQAQPSAPPEERLVTLTATISVHNSGDRAIDRYIQRLTIPLDDHAQQRLISIDYPYNESYTRKSHKKGNGEYLEFNWQLPANSRLVRSISFDMRLNSYALGQTDFRKTAPPAAIYLEPSKFIESDAEPVQRLAKYILRTYADDEDRLRAAYLYPQQALTYQSQPNRGALAALNERTGDCTEYATLFIALARAMGYHARLTSDFLFSKRNRFDRPNHHAAEVYLAGSWIPVDPNLALDPELGYGFGIGSTTKVVLKRDRNWVWSRWFPKSDRDYAKQYVETEIDWTIE